MNTTKTIVLMVGLTVLLVFIGGAIGGRQGMILAFIFAFVMNMTSYWFSDKIVLKMYNARQVTEAEAPVLWSVTHNLALKMNMPMPKVYVIPSEAFNAFATGRNPRHAAVAATEGILRLLSREELEGVMAHELGHVRNRDILIGTIAATIAGAISMIANIAQWTMIFGGFGGRRDSEEGNGGGGLIAGIAMIIIAPIAAMLIQMAISRSREYEADATGARVCGNPLGLANALRKLHAGTQRVTIDANPATAHMFIVNPLRGGGLANLFSTHPPMEERIARLESMVYGRQSRTGAIV
jgi:heat shock protein HtpX